MICGAVQVISRLAEVQPTDAAQVQVEGDSYQAAALTGEESQPEPAGQAVDRGASRVVGWCARTRPRIIEMLLAALFLFSAGVVGIAGGAGINSAPKFFVVAGLYRPSTILVASAAETPSFSSAAISAALLLGGGFGGVTTGGGGSSSLFNSAMTFGGSPRVPGGTVTADLVTVLLVTVLWVVWVAGLADADGANPNAQPGGEDGPDGECAYHCFAFFSHSRNPLRVCVAISVRNGAVR